MQSGNYKTHLMNRHQKKKKNVNNKGSLNNTIYKNQKFANNDAKNLMNFKSTKKKKRQFPACGFCFFPVSKVLGHIFRIKFQTILILFL